MGAAQVLQFTATFQHVGPCFACGIEMVLPSEYVTNRRSDKKNFFCPNGHAQMFPGKTALDLAKEETERAMAVAASARRDAEYQKSRREAAERSASAARGLVTKIKNRVGNGVCPCCNRSFQNLRRHMTTKHPAYAHDGDETP